jgi:hypothetical protein
MSEMIGNTARDAVVGGTISVIGGGKFANGAQTGASRYLFNEGMYHGSLITDVGDYIEFYNHRRFHETLAYKKPMDVYQKSIKLNQEKAKAS